MVVAPVGVLLAVDLKRERRIRRKAFIQTFAEGREVARVEGPVLLPTAGIVPREDGELVLLHDAAELGLDVLDEACGLFIGHPVGLGGVRPRYIHTHTELAALEELSEALADGQEDDLPTLGMAHAGEPIIGKYDIYVSRFFPQRYAISVP